MKELYEDEKGLVFVGEIPKNYSWQRYVVALMKAGVITENSVGILPIQKEDKGDYRELKEVKLFEISAVTLAANDQAKIMDVKGSSNMEDIYKRYDNLCKLIRKGDISDEMGYAIESEIYKLKSLFVDATQPVEETTEPVEQKSEFDVYKYLLNNLKIIFYKMEENIKNQLDQLGNIIDEKIEKATGQTLESANGKADESLKSEIDNLTKKFNERFDEFEVSNKKMFEKKNESKNFRTNLTKALNEGAIENLVKGNTNAAAFEIKADMTMNADYTELGSKR